MNWKPFAVVLVTAIASPALAAPVMHGGEWETRNNGGPINHTCLSGDHTFDAPTLTKMFAMEGVKCSPPKIATVGIVSTYEAICQVGGGQLTVKETLTATGPDAYITHSQSHFVGPLKLPDSDDTQVSRRIGPCKASDVKSPF